MRSWACDPHTLSLSLSLSVCLPASLAWRCSGVSMCTVVPVQQAKRHLPHTDAKPRFARLLRITQLYLPCCTSTQFTCCPSTCHTQICTPASDYAALVQQGSLSLLYKLRLPPKQCSLSCNTADQLQLRLPCFGLRSASTARQPKLAGLALRNHLPVQQGSLSCTSTA